MDSVEKRNIYTFCLFVCFFHIKANASSLSFVIQSKMKHKLDVPESFPNPAVVQAYLQPEVDPSTEDFSWSLPDLDAIRTYPNSRLLA